MKRFKFKLAVVLQERKKAEDLRLREWTLAKHFLQSLLDDLSALEKSLEDAIGQATQLASSPSIDNVGTFTTVEDFISGQKIRIVWKTQEIERSTKMTEKKRREYVGARQKREALEKLRERRLEEHNELALQDELRKLDDIYIMNGAARRRLDEEEEEEEEEVQA